jgi:hypothetical protein
MYNGSTTVLCVTIFVVHKQCFCSVLEVNFRKIREFFSRKMNISRTAAAVVVVKLTIFRFDWHLVHVFFDEVQIYKSYLEKITRTKQSSF